MNAQKLGSRIKFIQDNMHICFPKKSLQISCTYEVLYMAQVNTNCKCNARIRM